MRRAILLFLLCCCAVAGVIKRPQFLARRDYGSSIAGSSPAGFVAVADVNGDHIPDLISVTDGLIFTLLGNGNGTFRTGPTTPVEAFEPVPIDLNGDGKVDLVFSPKSGIGVCFGNGDGTFQQPVYYSVGDVDITNAVLGDFNGDGIVDAAVGGGLGIWLFTGKGGGAFNPGVLAAPVSGIRDDIVAADFNGDGHLDLAFITDTAFGIILGNGNGTFQSPATYAAASLPTWIATGDLNQDGHPDLAIAEPEVSSVYVYVNNGSGVFSTPSKLPLLAGQLAIGDVNGDHVPDLVTIGGGPGFNGGVSVGLGNGQFAPPLYYPVDNVNGSWNVVMADLRKPGLTDLVFGADPGISVLLNKGRGKFEDGEWISVPGAGNCGAPADFNGDGKPDLAVPTPQGIVMLFGTGKSSAPYTTGPLLAVSGPACPSTGDLNGDGIPDLVFGANGLGGVGAYLGNGDGTFRLASVIPMSPGVVVLGDFNHDGILDVADSSNQFALGKGDGTFQAVSAILASPPPSFRGFSWIAAGDVNNDGWTDILGTQANAGSELYVVLNNQNGGFALGSTITNSGGTNSVMAADLNRDGNLDVVVQTQNYATVYLGNGKGGFTVSQAQVAYAGPDTLPAQIGDVNGDGIPDLLLPADESIGIALGKGDGTFLTQFAVGAGPAPGQILLQNLHGQLSTSGLPDLVAPDLSGGVTVLINLTR